ncbi:MAG: tetratricopeptide repeat protein [Chloroflexi bacterium]|nr:tetratricopeptide repeat protein [Chloroflexota bacterium]MBV9543216.1 tetratricopeptide repeat protein [Chloroflexota bacterium]
MAAFPTEDRLRQKRTKSEQAISLAMKNRWDEAVGLNREILEMFPNEVDAYNRLGKALTELGKYADARDAYAHAVKLDPLNGIATKQLQRLGKLAAEGAAAPPPTPVDPRLFIEESGKTTVTVLTDLRRTEAVAKLGPGDQLQLERRGNQIMVVDLGNQEIGRIEPKLEQDLIRLLDLGNQYSVFVTASNDQSIHVIIRETHRSAQMGNRPSFRPAAAVEGGVRAYTREGVLRYELEEEEEEEEELLEEEEEETEAVPADLDVGVEETPLEALAAEEDNEESA